jgi:hypothetical protein
MELITKKQFDKLPRKVNGSPFKEAIKALKINTGIKVTKDEWAKTDYKTIPPCLISSSCHQKRTSLRGKRFSYRTLPDGWVVFRTK